MIGIASKLVSGLIDDSKKDEFKRSMIKRTLGLADEGIPIGREDAPVGYVRWQAKPSEATVSGGIEDIGDGSSLAWREFQWNEPATIDECSWQATRWRFYENGLICFEAKMSNTSGQLDNGDVQGHRVEVRESNGMLLGVWIAGFFVRKDLPLRGFQASFVDEHLPLKLHFREIADVQSGAWICI